MKKLLITLIMVMAMVFAGTDVFAALTATSAATVTLASALSVEFDTVNGQLNGTLNWTAANPVLYQYADGHSAIKSDVALICKNNNSTQGWTLKMHYVGTGTNPMAANKLYRYIGQPTMNSTSTGHAAVGQDAWTAIPLTTATTVYSATGADIDKNNLPNGTFVGVNVGLDPAGLVAGISYTATITYTVANIP